MGPPCAWVPCGPDVWSGPGWRGLVGAMCGCIVVVGPGAPDATVGTRGCLAPGVLGPANMAASSGDWVARLGVPGRGPWGLVGVPANVGGPGGYCFGFCPPGYCWVVYSGTGVAGCCDAYRSWFVGPAGGALVGRGLRVVPRDWDFWMPGLYFPAAPSWESRFCNQVGFGVRWG